MSVPTGILNNTVTRIISDMALRWTSTRGTRIVTTLRTYHRASRIRYVQSTGGATSAAWTQPTFGSNYIKVYVPYGPNMARIFARPNRAYHPTTNPAGYVNCQDGYYIHRGELIVNLAHEGLHAAQAIAGDGCLEEEVDARLAGNAGLKALIPASGTPQHVNATSRAAAVKAIKVDYPSLASDATYAPLGGSWPSPWTTSF